MLLDHNQILVPVGANTAQQPFFMELNAELFLKCLYPVTMEKKSSVQILISIKLIKICS